MSSYLLDLDIQSDFKLRKQEKKSPKNEYCSYGW